MVRDLLELLLTGTFKQFIPYDSPLAALPQRWILFRPTLNVCRRGNILYSEVYRYVIDQAWRQDSWILASVFLYWTQAIVQPYRLKRLGQYRIYYMSNAKLHSFNPSYVCVYRIRKERECLFHCIYPFHIQTTLKHSSLYFMMMMLIIDMSDCTTAYFCSWSVHVNLQRGNILKSY